MNDYPSIETLKANPILAIMTGHTCGEACWHAREEVCRCSCGGKNHGILKSANGVRPVRTRKIDGKFYELVAVGKYRDCMAEEKTLTEERFPGIDWCGYGYYRQESTMPIVTRKLSESALKWPEVQAVEGATYAVWSRPSGTRYLVRGPNYKSVYNDEVNHAN